MNLKVKSFIVNFYYAIISNIISLTVSMLVVLVVPKVIGVQQYSYWQLYLFYVAYIAFFHFGWSDGIYLKIGGCKYSDLDKDNLFSQFYMFVFFQIIISIVIVNFSYRIDIAEKKIIFIMLAITMIITNVRSLLVAILQATNRIKEYSRIIIIDRTIYILIIMILLFIGIKDFRILIGADIIGRTVSLIYSIICCKEIVFRRFINFSFSISESIENISIGIKLTLAYIASLLIIGVVRFAIELMWDVETFGKVSFSLSISNLLMVFINAIGVLLFPILKRVDSKKISNIYINIRNPLMIVMLGVLLFYYPLKAILLIWVPKYSESLKYMSLLFPIFIYECKMSILINTYLKSLRKEKLIMNINIISVFISIIITIFTVYLMKNLNIAVLSIIIILAFRATFSELLLSKLININVKKDILLEGILVCIFIISVTLLNNYTSIIVYCISYIIYLIIKRENIKSIFSNIKLLINM